MVLIKALVLSTLYFCAGLFVLLLIQALCFRFAVTWSIDVFSWYREVLNNLAGAAGA